jgi:predicted TIM-barrel fold metal-dependent hydrolase
LHPFTDCVRRHPLYLLDTLLKDIGSGHNIKATVYMDCGAHYRQDGPEEMRPVGETEYVVKVAEEAATRGHVGVCAGIVSRVDFLLGDAAARVVEAHVEAGRGRLRGIRQLATWDADPAVLGPLAFANEGLYRSDVFRAGFARLAALGLSFDACLLEPQMPDVESLARAFPETTIVLDHVGHPLGLGRYSGHQAERFAIWRDNLERIAACPNTIAKFGGFGITLGTGTYLADPPASEAQLVAEWAPYFEATMDAFGPNRSMFESNFPVDAGSCSYARLWNVFKRLAKTLSEAEKRALFSGTAAQVYKIDI